MHRSCWHANGQSSSAYKRMRAGAAAITPPRAEKYQWIISMKKRNCLAAFALLILSALFPPELSAQSKTMQSIYWIRYQNQLVFSPQLLWNNEIDNRRFFGHDVQTQLILHSRVHYRKGSWTCGAGLSFSWAYAQSPEQPVAHPTLEVRPVAEVSHELLIRNVAIQNRFRVDNRFVEADEDAGIFQNSTYTARFRYRLQARLPVVKQNDKTIVSVRLADEIMLNHRENTFDQNRIYLSTDVNISKRIAFEAGYIYIYQQRFGTGDFFIRHVLRFTFAHKIFL
jgi:hypothetical protein